MNIQSKVLEILEKNKGKERLFLTEEIITAALAVELCKYNEVGLMDLAVILSLSKQMKRKVVLKNETGFTCPSCNTSLFWHDGYYCKYCGQHLDWEYEEEVE